MRHLALATVLLVACSHGPSNRPPADPRERQRAEFVACWGGRMPPWLDDDAAAAARRMDRWGTLGSNPDDSFRPLTVSAAPPLPERAGDSGGSSGYAGILQERHEFNERCKLLRSVQRGPSLPAAR
jgi:hypothetical protein